MTDDEHIKKAVELAGIDLGQFIRDVANMNPYANTDHCIFCKEQTPSHRDDCNWVKIGGGR